MKNTTLKQIPEFQVAQALEEKVQILDLTATVDSVAIVFKVVSTARVALKENHLMKGSAVKVV